MALLLAAASMFLLLIADVAQGRTVWLCKPGLDRNPCSTGLSTTVVSPSGVVLGKRTVRRARDPAVDCFYLYPTVSTQPRAVSNLRIEPEQRAIARLQAARYSQHCRVFAPMYRQQTLAGLGEGDAATPAQVRLAYRSVRAAWRTYRRDNRGRGFALISHSQGSELLRRLIAEEIEPMGRLRRRMVSAQLLGGNVAVARGRPTGGDFRRIPACRARTQLGCVVAYSTFSGRVPADAVYGRIGGPFNPGDPAKLDVLCTNPASLGGGTGRLVSVYPRRPGALVAVSGVPVPRVSTPWYEFRGAYDGACSAAGGAHVLQVAGRRGAPLLNPLPDPTWGVHLLDVNIALGNLVDLLGAQIRAYR